MIEESKVLINSFLVSKFINISIVNISEQLIPNYEYRYPITVTLSIPGDSLRNINSKNVTIYVTAIIETDSNDVYFKDGSSKTNTSLFTLICNIENNNSDYTCSKNSISSRQIEVFIFSNYSKNNISAEIKFYASPTPFDNFTPIFQQSISLRNELNQIISNLNTSDPKIQELVNKTEEALSTFHIEEAKSNMEKLKMQSGNSFWFSISYLINQIVGYIRSIFDFVSLDFGYFLAFVFSLVLIFLILLFRIRRNGKIALISLSILSAVLVILKLLPLIFLFFIQILILVLTLSIVYARNQSKRKFRTSDNYVGPEYDAILKRRK